MTRPRRYIRLKSTPHDLETSLTKLPRDYPTRCTNSLHDNKRISFHRRSPTTETGGATLIQRKSTKRRSQSSPPSPLHWQECKQGLPFTRRRENRCRILGIDHLQDQSGVVFGEQPIIIIIIVACRGGRTKSQESRGFVVDVTTTAYLSHRTTNTKTTR